jgi:hypothetical protein
VDDSDVAGLPWVCYFLLAMMICTCFKCTPIVARPCAYTCSEAADYLLQGRALSNLGLKGVCYYDSLVHRAWVIKDPLGRVMPRHSSPVAEREVGNQLVHVPLRAALTCWWYVMLDPTISA